MTRRRDTVLRGRHQDFRGLKTRFRQKREKKAGELRRIVGNTPTMTFAEAQERDLVTQLASCTDEEFLAFLVEYQDVDPVARRLLKKVTA